MDPQLVMLLFYFQILPPARHRKTELNLTCDVTFTSSTMGSHTRAHVLPQPLHLSHLCYIRKRFICLTFSIKPPPSPLFHQASPMSAHPTSPTKSSNTPRSPSPAGSRALPPGQLLPAGPPPHPLVCQRAPPLPLPPFPESVLKAGRAERTKTSSSLNW